MVAEKDLAGAEGDPGGGGGGVSRTLRRHRPGVVARRLPAAGRVYGSFVRGENGRTTK